MANVLTVRGQPLRRFNNQPLRRFLVLSVRAEPVRTDTGTLLAYAHIVASSDSLDRARSRMMAEYEFGTPLGSEFFIYDSQTGQEI